MEDYSYIRTKGKLNIMKRIWLIILATSCLLSILVTFCLRSVDDGKDKDKDKIEQILENERNIRNMMLAVIVLTAITSYMAVDKISTARRKAEIRNRRLERNIEILEREKDMLSCIRDEGTINNEMRGLLEERLKVLNGFITAYISGNCSEKAYSELEKFMSDRRGFIESTKLSFAIGHPRFLIFLKEHGLTDQEIGYCCLHAIGLNGKEIVSYLNSRSYYNASSTIRKKLGLNEHDTNINIYIQRLIKEIEE